MEQKEFPIGCLGGLLALAIILVLFIFTPIPHHHDGEKNPETVDALNN
jgi:hypothetical protein